ncbi:type I polyketide synthase [Streptomyces millisiae]|uniref:Type I polyketide synthase n=1 Tax=Streptomyces millisiae TaxID=3075542 RepID=A0ABU2LJ80_9ACTN|nr:type I polyketide synthase [Streptomyces sp. DSM 44918]MDT0317188.1 type I polyketide synthase [Streptomyces sp. DSM 44918]
MSFSGTHTPPSAPIAVVGMGCRFPGGATGIEKFWDLLVSGRSGVVEVPADRWNLEDFFDPDPDAAGRSYSRHGGFVDGVREFDAGLFGVGSEEALGVDPQHRLVLEVAWEALEHAGIAPDSLRGTRTGVFVGMGGSDFERLRLSAGDVSAVDGYFATGSAQNMAANRLSFALGLEGPSLVVDTACSSSLVAVHLACQALRSGECDTALVAGVNLMLSPGTTVALSQGRFLSPTGRCNTFDATADGYVRGEGCGVVVLRRADVAREAGQRVWAVVRGSATNQDGRSNGLTAPRGGAQEEVIRRALAAGDVRPAEVGYVEAHGTGTALGDPIEVRALAAVLGDGRTEAGTGPVALGSVKTNIGHLEAGAGIAGLIKTVLVLDRGVVPPHPHLTRPNPYIPWAQLPVTVPTTATPWPDERRVAGVSSFGFGGTNAHVVLESPPPVAADGPARPSGPVLVKVTGRGRAAVAAGAERLAAWARDAESDVTTLAWAAGTGRADLTDRAAVVAETLGEAAELLDAVAAGRPAPGVVQGRRGTGGAPRVGFVVPGQGPRLAGALAGVYGRVPVVTEVVDEVARSVGPVSGLPLSVLLDDSEESAAALADTAVVQPALFTVAVALGRWWQSIGVRPAMVLGHSAGAYAAAVLAGVFSLEDGIRLTSARARLMGGLPPVGAMAAVFCPAEELAEVDVVRDGRVVIASYNGPRETVVSGPTEAVLALLDEMAGRGVKSVRLRVSYASHGPLMEPVLGPLREAFEGVELHRPTTEFVSDSTGELAGPEVATVDYWVRHTRRPVLFSTAMRTMLDRRIGVVIELGPGGLLPLFLSVAGERELVCAPSVVVEGGVPRGLLESAGRVWAAGVDIDWSRVNGSRPVGPPPALPTYPFQRLSYWPDLAEGPAPAAVRASGRPELAAVAEPVDVPSPATRPARDEREDARRVAALVSYLRGGLADVMELPEGDELDADTGLFDLGLTSAMVVRLRARFERDLGRRVPTTAVFEHPTISRLARYLADMGAVLVDSRATTEPPVDAPEAAPSPADAQEPIAIVGMACRFPGGANDLDSYWRLLREGRDATSPVPAGRWDGYADPASTPSLAGFRGGFLDVPVDAFDAEAFGITPREARTMDPQQRLLLEVVWEALEDAGLPVSDLEGSPTSVFVGMTTLDYLQLLSADATSGADAYQATGNTFSVAAGRLSYFLGTRGPSMAVDTACSSSLVATHLAIRSLRSGESNLSIVAGVNLLLSPATTTSLANLGALASDGRCKTFDATADGYGRGEGAGVVILKRLRDARADGDHVWAVLRGSAVNQDGRSAGLTVPNGQAQQSVIREALRDAGAEASSVGYVEAHGTGTALGDPIEVDALMAVLRPDRGDQAPALRVGSVKTNLGHLEAAAGVAGLIKTALTLHHGEIPPHLHLNTPSPHIDWDGLPLEIPDRLTEWAPGEPRLAGLSAFGFGGTNAHVVLGAAPPDAEPASVPEPAEGPALLVLSARTRPALAELAERYRESLVAGQGTGAAAGWPAVAWHAATRRTHLPERLAVTAPSADRAAELLAAAARGEQHRELSVGRVVPGDRRRLVLAYSGQGSQWAGMGVDLLSEPVAGDVLRRCDELVRDLAGWSLLDELRAPAASSRLADTAIAQPGIFAVQAALTELWRRWGISPDAVVGHSVGEVAAAHAAGALTLEQAVSVVVRRGEVMASTRGSGAMVAVGLSAESAAELIEPYGDLLSLAAVNGPGSVVVAGDPAALADLEPLVRGRRAHWARIQDEYAFHTPRMLQARPELLRALDGLTPAAPAVPVFSTVTGEPAGPGSFDAAYWAENMVRPVRFADALRAAADPKAHHVVLEVGPHAVLGSAAAQSLGDRCAAVTTVASQRARRDGRATLLTAAGQLHVLGYELDHRALFGAGGTEAPGGVGRGRVSLPTYPWQRGRHWLPRPPARTATPPGTQGTDDFEDELADALYEFQWQPAEGPAPEAVGTAPAKGDWLVVADRGGVARHIAERLTAGGGRCVVVPPEKLDPAAPDTARELLSGLDALRGLVHCGALDAGHTTAPGSETADALALSCGPLLTAARVLPGADAGAAPRVWVVTRGATGAEGSAVTPSQGPVWGLGRVVALERPELWGGLVDLDPAAENPAADADAVVAELLRPGGPGDEDQIARRAGTRLVARLRRADRLPPAEGPTISGTASYLITGGRGALGLRVAEWLVGRGARHLVLTGRRPLAEDADDPVVAAVRRMREAGATVHTPDVDVADREAMAALFAPEAPWPPVRGVVHAAGTFNPCAAAELDWDRFRAMCRAKVDGTLVLDALTRDAELDFFVMFSSASAVWGSALAGHYAAANSFLDAMAHHRASRGLPGLAVDWGWWSGSDLVAGEHLDHFEAMGLHVLPDRVGFAALERLLGSDRRQLTVAPVDWARFRPVLEARRRRPLLERLGAASDPVTADEGLLDALRAARGGARTRLLEERLRREVAAVLGLDAGHPGLDRDSGFSDAGMDSVMSVELKNRLDRVLGVVLPATAAFEHPTVAALSEYLLTLLALPTEEPPAGEIDEDPAARLDGLSEAELLELLDQELDQSPASTESPLETS